MCNWNPLKHHRLKMRSILYTLENIIFPYENCRQLVKKILVKYSKYPKILDETVGEWAKLSTHGMLIETKRMYTIPQANHFPLIVHTQIEQIHFQSLRNSLSCELKGLSVSMICHLQKSTEVVSIRLTNKSKPFSYNKIDHSKHWFTNKNSDWQDERYRKNSVNNIQFMLFLHNTCT